MVISALSYLEYTLRSRAEIRAVVLVKYSESLIWRGDDFVRPVLLSAVLREGMSTLDIVEGNKLKVTQ